MTERNAPPSRAVLDRPLRRRSVLAGGLAGAATLATAGIAGAPGLVRAQDRSLKVGVYGGYFKEAFDEHIFPRFTRETGIAVESIAEPTGEAWLVQLQQAARAGQAPADVSMMARTPMLKGIEADLWMPLEGTRIRNLVDVMGRFIVRYPDDTLAGVGAVSWYITLVTNTDAYPEPPDSWAALWDPGNRDRLGLLALVSNSFLLEVTARTFFDTTDVLSTPEGLDKVFAKLAELKPNVRLWYRDEAQFEQALKSGEIPMGQYYHDVTGLAAADGQPVRSTFPQEGGIQDSGVWAVSKASAKGDEAHEFIDWMCGLQVQSLMARQIGVSPVVDRELLDLSDEEFAAVSSEIDPIEPRYDLYGSMGDELAARWSELIAG